MDYGKYNRARKESKRGKKKSHQTEVKEENAYKIDKHDYDVCIGQATKFLKSGDKVKCTVIFRVNSTLKLGRNTPLKNG